MKILKPSTDYADRVFLCNLRNVWIKALLLLVFVFPLHCSAQQVVDKMVATVNAGVRTDLITYSDLMWQLALQPHTLLDNPSSEDLNRALRLFIDQRLKMEKYLDFRFRNFVVISQKEIADYYRDVYTPRVKARLPGRIVPPLEQVRDEIEKTLMESKIESDTDAFLDTARERAEVVMLNPV